MSLLILISVLGILLVGSSASFDVYWNTPSSACSNKYGINVTDHLLQYKVLVNNGESFNGDKIVIFYEGQLGKYPHIDIKTGVDVNGGIPQLANLNEHLELARKDIENVIPNPNFDGVGVIDWESWRPIYDYNWGKMQIYKDRSRELVKKHNTSLPKNVIEITAKKQWEEAAKQWMLDTLELAKEMRPKAKWCYYLFPDCYNYDGKDEPSQFFCSKRIQEHNDRLSWLWKSSTALCPSIYFYSSQEKYNEQQRLWFLYGRLAEARRVSSPTTAIYPYVTYKSPDTKLDVPEEHFWRMFSLSASMGLDGMVIWGSSNYVRTKEDCKALDSYVKDVIGPVSFTVSSNFNICSRTICSYRGRCTWPDEPYSSWRYFTKYDAPNFGREEIVCRCAKIKSRYCNMSCQDYV